MLRLSLSSALVCAALGGCTLGGQLEPLPLVGDAPQTIAIWPFVAGGQPPDDELWFTGLAYQLGRRGYRVIAPGITRELLLASDLTASFDDAATVGRALMADAVLHLELREFNARTSGSLQQARWDIAWRLVSTRGQGQQWTYGSHGRWRQGDRDPIDATRRFDEMATPRPIVPIGGHRLPGFRDLPDLLAYLNRGAMERLPARPGS